MLTRVRLKAAADGSDAWRAAPQMGDDRAYLGDESMDGQDQAYAYKSWSILVLVTRIEIIVNTSFGHTYTLSLHFLSIPKLAQNTMSDITTRGGTSQCRAVPIVEGASDHGGRRRRGLLAAHGDAQSRARHESGAGEKVCHAE